MTAPQVDPIWELINALNKNGKPSLYWIAKYGPGGREPVQMAWQESKCLASMVTVIYLGYGATRAAELLKSIGINASVTMGRDKETGRMGQIVVMDGVVARDPGMRDGTYARMLRDVASPPTLQELIAGRRG